MPGSVTAGGNPIHRGHGVGGGGWGVGLTAMELDFRGLDVTLKGPFTNKHLSNKNLQLVAKATNKGSG